MTRKDSWREREIREGLVIGDKEAKRDEEFIKLSYKVEHMIKILFILIPTLATMIFIFSLLLKGALG